MLQDISLDLKRDILLKNKISHKILGIIMILIIINQIVKFRILVQNANLKTKKYFKATVRLVHMNQVHEDLEHNKEVH